MSNIARAFAKGKAFIPFITCGAPDLETTARAVRAMAEAAGYSVSWDKNRGAVVYDENKELVFSVFPGQDVLQTPDGETTISAPCLKEGGATYLPLEDLCYWLNLYLARG